MIKWRHLINFMGEVGKHKVTCVPPPQDSLFAWPQDIPTRYLLRSNLSTYI